MTTLKELDKLAWSWADCNPKQITIEHIIAAYRIKQNYCKNKSCRRNCRGNPLCLAGLGEARLAENINNPQDDTSMALPRREPGNFVGLKNLGATCYVNSLLQLWFHNKAFRDAILSWNPKEDPEESQNMTLYAGNVEYQPQTVMGHLQRLFALLYYSRCRYIDPCSIVETLRLDPSTQQDAQEFSKLFISLLENTLKHQKLKFVRNLISDNFRGEYVYVTRCCKCMNALEKHEPFYELDLNVKGHQNLMECLVEFLEEEKLDGGAECYSCVICQTKQKACRSIRLCSLPPVLNLQLLRYVFDREKGQKKKLKTVVQFPEVLDMSALMESETPIIYNLSAVLIHKGTRASSGHYIAYIKNAETGTWNSFNDEAVEKLQGKKLTLDEEDPESTEPKKAKGTKLPKGVQSSTDAYMLVYTVDNHQTADTEVQLSPLLQRYVDSQNKIFDELCIEIDTSKKQNVERQEQTLELYNLLTVDGLDNLDNLSEISVIPTEWLTSWLDSKVASPPRIDVSRLLCTHGKLDPCEINQAKYVTSTAAASLYNQYGGAPPLDLSNALCKPCISNRCHIITTKAKTAEENKEITNLLKRNMTLDEPGYFIDKYSLKTWRNRVIQMVEAEYSTKRAGNGDVSEPFSEESLPVADEMSQPVSQPSQTHALQAAFPTASEQEDSRDSKRRKGIIQAQKNKSCMHTNKLNIVKRRRLDSTVSVPLSEIRNCILLSKSLQANLSSSNYHVYKASQVMMCKKLTTKLETLTVPKKSVKLRRISGDEKDHKDTQDEKPSDDKLEPGSSNDIPTCSSENTAVKQEDDATKCDQAVDSKKGFNEGIMCEHGNLSANESERKLVPVRVWKIVKQYFPSAPTFPSHVEPCRSCQNVANEDEAIKLLYYECALNQKKELSDLFSLRNRPVPGQTNDTIYVLSKFFYVQWSAFLKGSARRDTSAPCPKAPPPESLMVDQLLCMHGKMHYSVDYEDDLEKLVLVTPQEWSSLTERFSTEHEVIVPPGPDLATIPGLCESCFTARLESEQQEKFNYERAKLSIRLVPSSSSVDDSESSECSVSKKRKVNDEPTSPVSADLKKAIKAATGALPMDVRRSSRTRRAPGQKDIRLTVSSSDTLRDLKRQITNHFPVAPFDQHLLTLEGRELEGDYNTLSSLGVLPDTTLLLQVDEPKESFEDLMEDCSTPTEPEVGFKGTGLLQQAS